MDYLKLAQDLIRTDLEYCRKSVFRQIVNMTKGELLALGYLAEHGDGVHPGSMSRDMFISTARVAALLNGLEKKGMICRKDDPEDDRQIYVQLTEKGKNYLEGRMSVLLDDTAKLLGAVGERDAEEYLRIRKKMLAAVSHSE